MRITEMDNREQTDVIARLDVRCVYEVCTTAVC